MSTFLSTVSDASSLANVGEAWTIRVRTVDENGYATGTTTPSITITRPDASTSSPVLAADVLYGDWLVRYTVLAAGRHVAHVSTVNDALDVAMYAAGPTTESGMPTTDDLARYLQQNASSWTTLDLADALAAERAAQRARCGERAVYPADLRQALLRRAQRNLAMRRLPLAINTGDADGGSLVIPGRDPEVRRLEGPYRRLVTG